MQSKKVLHITAFSLVIFGALDLGLFAVLPADVNGQGFDVIRWIFGFSPLLVDTINILIGASGIYLLVTHAKDCLICSSSKSSKSV